MKNAPLFIFLIALAAFCVVGSSCDKQKDCEQVTVTSGVITKQIEIRAKTFSSDQFTALAPFAGRVSEVFKKIGEDVEKGDVIARYEILPASLKELNKLRDEYLIAKMTVEEAVDTFVVPAAVSGQVKSIAVKINEQVSEGQLLMEIEPTVDMAPKIEVRSPFNGYVKRIYVQDGSVISQSDQFVLMVISKHKYLGPGMVRSLLIKGKIQPKIRQAVMTYLALSDKIDTFRETMNHDFSVTSHSQDTGFIYSPQGGTLNWAALQVKDNGVFNAGEPLVIVSGNGIRRLAGRVHEVDVHKLSSGNRCEILFDAFPDSIFAGEIEEIAKEVEQNPGGNPMQNKTYQVTIRITQGDRKSLLNAMSSSVKVFYGKGENVPVLPLRCLSALQNSRATVMENGKWVEKNIALGDSDNASVQIKEGLNPGDVVCISKTGH